MRDDSPGYIASHWHGKLPLGEAFWINLVIIPGVLFLAVTGSFFKANESHDASLVLPLSLYAALLVVSVWAMRGAFLSAQHHVDPNGGSTRKNMAIAGVALYAVFLLLTSVPVWVFLLAASLSKGRV